MLDSVLNAFTYSNSLKLHNNKENYIELQMKKLRLCTCLSLQNWKIKW